MRQRLSSRIIALTVILVGGVGLTLRLEWANESLYAQQELPPPLPALDPPIVDTPPTSERFTRVIEIVSPNVVAVDVVRLATDSTMPNQALQESGSGVLVTLEQFEGIYAITNNHVIQSGRPIDITVTLADARILQPTKVWRDPASDIAILKMPFDTLPHAQLGDSDRVAVGQWVLAFGSPFGLNQTVTQGIISARNRGQISLGDTIRIKEFLQTDAAINPGSSGGPLVDLQGKVIGINAAIASNNGNNSGVSFSIPSNLVRRIARELLTQGRVERGYLGIQLAPALEPSEALKLGLDRLRGALVERVHPRGPADQAGLKIGDVILKFDSVAIENENHLINLVGELPVGQRSTLTVWRDRRMRTTEIVIERWENAKP